MNRDETRNVLTFLRANYPASFRWYSEDSSTMLLDIWSEGLKDFPPELVQKAVFKIVMNDDREFAPNIAAVRKACMAELLPDPGEEALDQWKKVKAFLRTIGHDAQDFDEYVKLPEPIREVYSLNDLRSMALNKAEDNDNFEKPRFLKAYSEQRRADMIKQIENGSLMIETQTKG